MKLRYRLGRITAAMILLAPSVAWAQTRVVQGYFTSAGCPGGVASCWKPYDTTGTGIPALGSFSASLTGFAPATVGTPIVATTGGVTGTLPVGSVVVVTNAGTVNGAFVALGASSSTSQQYIPPGGWFAFTVGTATLLTAITSAGTTTINMVGGAGLPTGTGGGGGGTSGVTTRTLVTLDVKTVTTGGTAVIALTAGHRTAGGFLFNPAAAAAALCINEIGTASGTTSSGDTTCIAAGQSYVLAPSTAAASVISSDSSHPFSGYGLQ